MDANTIIQIISSLGFPIVMCGETKAGAPKRYDCGKYESVSRINNAY